MVYFYVNTLYQLKFNLGNGHIYDIVKEIKSSIFKNRVLSAQNYKFMLFSLKQIVNISLGKIKFINQVILSYHYNLFPISYDYMYFSTGMSFILCSADFGKILLDLKLRLFPE